MSQTDTAEQTKLVPRCRWMISRDMPVVMDIEKESFGEDAWSEEYILEIIQKKNVIGMVVTINNIDGAVAGFFFYQADKDRLVLLNMAVARKWRRRGFGSAILAQMRSKMSQKKRSLLLLDYRDERKSWLKMEGADQFFDSTGLKLTVGIRRYPANWGFVDVSKAGCLGMAQYFEYIPERVERVDLRAYQVGEVKPIELPVVPVKRWVKLEPPCSHCGSQWIERVFE